MSRSNFVGMLNGPVALLFNDCMIFSTSSVEICATMKLNWLGFFRNLSGDIRSGGTLGISLSVRSDTHKKLLNSEAIPAGELKMFPFIFNCEILDDKMFEFIMDLIPIHVFLDSRSIAPRAFATRAIATRTIAPMENSPPVNSPHGK